MYNMYKQPSAVDEAIYILSLIIAIVITIISLVKFFKLCKNVAYIADVLKAQQNNLTTAQSGDNPTEQSAQEPTTTEAGLSWSTIIIAILLIAFFIATLYFLISEHL